jgi:hypothetical protein
VNEPLPEQRVVTIGFPGRKVGIEREHPLPARVAARVLREAAEYLGPFGLPLDQYDGQVTRTRNDYTLVETIEVTWRHRTTGAEVVLTNLYITARGAILQAGTQYGRLTL